MVAKADSSRYALAGLVCLLAFCSMTGPALGAGRTAEKPKMQKISLLYVLNARSGTLIPRKRSPARYKLVLKGLDRNVIWFSDRPARRSSSFPTSGLVKGWKGFGFSGDPPNAALSYTDERGDSGRTVILVLSKPRLARGRLSFDARALDPRLVDDPNLHGHAVGADRHPAHRFTDASLFLDDTEAPVVDHCVIEPETMCPEWFFRDVDLTGADLEGAELTGSLFTDVNLSGANLAGANLSLVGWRGSDLDGAELFGADLSLDSFWQSSLVRAKLVRANLYETDFYYDDLEYAILTNANIWAPFHEPLFEESNLCNVTWSNGLMAEHSCSLP